MAWNQPGKGDQEPWKGKDPGNEVEAFLGRLRGMFGGSGGGRGRGRGGPGGFNPVPWVLGLFGIWLVFNSFQLVNERERAVVLRFGEYNRIMEPGPNFKLPWPIESVTTVEATQIEPVSDRMMVLTRDENLVQVQYNVQYLIVDPQAFLFGTRDPRGLLQQTTESAVREVVGNATLDVALYNRAGRDRRRSRRRTSRAADRGRPRPRCRGPSPSRDLDRPFRAGSRPCVLRGARRGRPPVGPGRTVR